MELCSPGPAAFFLTAHAVPNLQVIARSLPTQELQGIREMFKAIDEDNSGCITVDELR